MYIEDDLEQFEQATGNNQPLDPEKYQAYVKSPADIDEETMYQLADIIDGRLDIKPHYTPGVKATPKTVDRLLNSVTIVYITFEDLPVAVASIIDPTQTNYMGFVPLDLYSMYSAQNLDGRVQMEFFAVADEYDNTQVPTELFAQINQLGTPVYMVTDSDDEDSNTTLQENGFTPVANMDIGSNESPVILWLDHVENIPEEAEEQPDENEVISDI